MARKPASQKARKPPAEPEHPLITRARIAQEVTDEFVLRDFAWWDADCGRLADAVVRRLGIRSPLATMHRYTSERGALKAIRKAGYRTLDALVDGMGFPRIAPAESLAADIIGFRPGLDGFGVGLGVALTGGRCLLFVKHELVGGVKAVIGKGYPDSLCAWRVPV